MTQSIWHPLRGPTSVPRVLGWGPNAAGTTLPITRGLARIGGAGTALDGTPRVRDLWMPASAGALNLSLALLAALGWGVSVGVRGLHLAVIAVVAAAWVAVVLALMHRLLSATRGHRVRWRHLLSVLVAGGLGLFAAAPVTTLAGLAPDVFRISAEGRLLLALVALPWGALLIGLALLALAAVSGPRAGRRLDLPPLLAPPAPEAAVLSLGPVTRGWLWVGGLRDDLSGRWPRIDRFHSARAWMVATNALFGGVAAGLAADAVVPGTWLTLPGAVVWSFVSGALARHHMVVRADADPNEERRFATLGGLVAAVAGLVTAALLVVGLLLRTAMLPLAGLQAPSIVTLAATLFAGSPTLGLASLIVTVFAVFIHLLPALPWRAGDVSPILREVVTLFDAVAEEASGEEGSTGV